MKIHRFIAALAISAISVYATAEEALQKTIALTNIDEVYISGDASIALKQSELQTVEITAIERDVERITVYENDGKLYLTVSQVLIPRNLQPAKIKFVVSIPHLNTLKTTFVREADITGFNQNASMALEIKGNTKLRLSDIKSPALKLHVMNTSTASLDNITLAKADITLQNDSLTKINALNAKNVNIQQSNKTELVIKDNTIHSLLLNTRNQATIKSQGSNTVGNLSSIAKNISKQHLGNVEIKSAEITLKNKAIATLNVIDSLSGSIKNNSHLTYFGTPEIHVTNYDNAKISHKK